MDKKCKLAMQLSALIFLFTSCIPRKRRIFSSMLISTRKCNMDKKNKSLKSTSVISIYGMILLWLKIYPLLLSTERNLIHASS